MLVLHAAAKSDAFLVAGGADNGTGPDLAPKKRMPWSGPNLFAGLLFSSIGFVGFIYGKRMSAWKPMFLGLALMAYPYFIEDTVTICAIGLAGTAALFWARN
jgi:hypothetical protein